jgi:hypothetical protein
MKRHPFVAKPQMPDQLELDHNSPLPDVKMSRIGRSISALNFEPVSLIMLRSASPSSGLRLWARPASLQ